MEIQVVEGRLAQTPVADGAGVDRRAFGEFVSPRGELASYAFGWTTGSDSHVARWSIGIGAGNPGGGTFHAVMFDHDECYAFSLVSEPFVLWVADQVMERDRRAWWMRHWLLGTTTIFDCSLCP